tara:strand:- start:508 stop:1146 length:639 start_codon:yes stop_codon:yes gene_type:complete
MKLLLLLLPLAAALKLPAHTAPLSRRSASALIATAPLAAALPALAYTPPPQAIASEDEDDNDEIPDVRSGRPAPTPKKSEQAKKKDYTPEDGRTAFKDIVASRKVLDKADALLASKDYASISALLDAAPVSSFGDNALILLNSKAIKDPDAIKQIGTIKRYGVGADVSIMLGGLSEAARGSDAAGAKSYLDKAKSSLDELIIIGKGAGLALS